MEMRITIECLHMADEAHRQDKVMYQFFTQKHRSCMFADLGRKGHQVRTVQAEMAISAT